MLRHAFFLVILALAQLSHASFVPTGYEGIDTLAWEFVKRSSGVDVYRAKVPDSAHRAVLAETTIDASAESVLMILRNPDLCEKWVHRCQYSKLHAQPDSNTDYIYTQSRVPFPFPDRDVLAKINWRVDPKSGAIYGVGSATDGVIPDIKKRVRIKNASMIWVLKPISENRTDVASYAHVDPGGRLPAWLTNKVSTKGAIQTLLGLKKICVGG